MMNKKIVVKKAPRMMWYSTMIGKEFDVIEYDDNYEAYLVEVKGYSGRYIYKVDCYDLPDNVSTTARPVDSILDEVVDKFKQRADAGWKKYGHTMDRDDLSPLEWMEHMREELMDGILYLTKIMREYDNLLEDMVPELQRRGRV